MLSRFDARQEIIEIGLQIRTPGQGKIASYSVATTPSMPGAPSLRVRRYASSIHSPLIR
jgi:hypothetical protein